MEKTPVNPETVQPATPLQLAEELSVVQLGEYYHGRKRRPYLELSRTAQYLLELSLGPGGASDGDHGVVRSAFLAMTEGSLPYEDRAFSPLYTEACILQAQLSVFEARSEHGYQLPIDNMGQAHAAMVSLLAMRCGRRKGRLKVPLYESRRSELELAGLLSRLGEAELFPYYAVAREERDHVFSDLNHDCYVVRGGSKVPIQIKTVRREGMKKYDPRVLVIARSDLSGVCHDVAVKHGGIAELLIGEDRQGLSYRERRRLKSLSDYMKDLIDEHVETTLR